MLNECEIRYFLEGRTLDRRLPDSMRYIVRSDVLWSCVVHEVNTAMMPPEDAPWLVRRTKHMSGDGQSMHFIVTILKTTVSTVTSKLRGKPSPLVSSLTT